MSQREHHESKGTLADAINKLSEVVRDGLRHGFFECKVTSEILNGRKRGLTIRAGKSHRFVIEEEELRD
jgi:hypothetical protein